MCTPNDRWTPEQLRQMKTPKFEEALRDDQSESNEAECACIQYSTRHVGFLVPQSAQLLFAGSFST